MRRIYQLLAGLVDARLRSIERGNTEWVERHAERIARVVSEYLPSGSGFDSGTTLDLDVSKPDRLVFRTAFHHMNEGGYYDGWTDHNVIVTPSLAFGFNLRITGRDRNEIKDYIAETFRYVLDAERSEPVTS